MAKFLLIWMIFFFVALSWNPLAPHHKNNLADSGPLSRTQLFPYITITGIFKLCPNFEFNQKSHFSFLVTFGDEVTKIRKYYVIFVYILQGKMGKTEKKITQLK